MLVLYHPFLHAMCIHEASREFSENRFKSASGAHLSRNAAVFFSFFFIFFSPFHRILSYLEFIKLSQISCRICLVKYHPRRISSIFFYVVELLTSFTVGDDILKSIECPRSSSLSFSFIIENESKDWIYISSFPSRCIVTTCPSIQWHTWLSTKAEFMLRFFSLPPLL